MKGKKTLF